MPRLDPFPGVRYQTEDGYLDAVVSPPYDVISPTDRARLLERSEFNSVRIELPAEEDGLDRYQVAASLWEQWRAKEILVADPEPSFYLYRMGYHDGAGRPRQTTGVVGALELVAPGEGGILPHERTTPKDKADRLDLLRACRANLSPIWALSAAEGLSAVLEPSGPPDARATDDEGVHHRLWRVHQPALAEAIATTVATTPVVIADGHHRFETALAYRDERRAATGGAPGAYDAVMAFVVELSEEQLMVRPVHRLLSGLAEGLDLVEALSTHFEPAPAGPPAATLPARMAEAGALGLVTAGTSWLLRPRAEMLGAAQDLDSSRLEIALATLADHTVVYQHGVDHVLAAVASGRAQAGVLLRPASVAQIAATGRGGERMPPKTTFFEPKPRTGMVFREVSG
ncbi:MAG: DUF1015 domain-containing protein [Actinomycetota bacterium]|nr:DUF1015 domain-containing protein [Actinomycetota bacterium]